RLSGRVGRVRVRPEVVVERDVLLEDDDQVLDRGRRRRFVAAVAVAVVVAVRERADRADACENCAGQNGRAEDSSGASQWAPLHETGVPLSPVGSPAAGGRYGLTRARRVSVL